MAGPKVKSKLTKPGFGYKFEKAFAKYADKKTRIGGGFLSMGEYIARGMPRGQAQALVNKYKKQAEMIIKARAKNLKKLRFKSIQKQKQKQKKNKKG